MAQTTCLLVLLVTAAKIYIEEQAVAAQNKAVKQTRQSGLPTMLGPISSRQALTAMFGVHLSCFVRPTSAWSSKLIFNNLRYLCHSHLHLHRCLKHVVSLSCISIHEA
jgi:hypothetical protein